MPLPAHDRLRSLLAAIGFACWMAGAGGLALVAPDARAQDNPLSALTGDQSPDEEQAEPAALPDPVALEPGWWSYLAEAPAGELGQRIDELIATAEARIAELPEEERTQAEESSSRLAANLRGYARLTERVAAEPPTPAPFAESYTVDEVLALDRQLRDARRRIQSERAELDNRKSTADALGRQVDTRLAAHLEAPERSAERVLLGMRVLAGRAALELEREQIRLLEARLAADRAQREQLEKERSAAIRHLSVEGLDPAALERQAAAARERLEVRRRELRERETALIEATTDGENRREAVAVARLRSTLASIAEAEAALAVAQVEARLDLATLAGESPDPAAAADRLREHAALLERVSVQRRTWAEAGERNLSRSSQELLEEARGERDNRALLAAESLTALQSLRSEIEDLELLQDLVGARLRETESALRRLWRAAGDTLGDLWRGLGELSGMSPFSVGGTPVTLLGLMRVALILLAAFWASRLLRHGLERVGSRRKGMSQSSLYVLGRLAHYVIIFAGIIFGLSSIGLDFSNLALIASALSVGIGFGLQSIVSNFVSGLILLFERSLNVGDFVELDSGINGVIREINVRSTLINTNDNVDVLVPNSEFVNGKLINWTLREAIRRIHVEFGVAYGTDKELTRKAALEAAEEVPFTLTGPGREPQVWLVNFGDSSLDYELVVWVTADAVRRPAAIKAAYLWEIETALARHGIEIPFPQRDLHVRSGAERLRGRDSSRKADEADTPAKARETRQAGEGTEDAAASE